MKDKNAIVWQIWQLGSMSICTNQNLGVLDLHCRLLNCAIPRLQNESNKVVIKLRVVQFWSEIILVILDQIALHSVQLQLFIFVFFIIIVNIRQEK